MSFRQSESSLHDEEAHQDSMDAFLDTFHQVMDTTSSHKELTPIGPHIGWGPSSEQSALIDEQWDKNGKEMEKMPRSSRGSDCEQYYQTSYVATLPERGDAACQGVYVDQRSNFFGDSNITDANKSSKRKSERGQNRIILTNFNGTNAQQIECQKSETSRKFTPSKIVKVLPKFENQSKSQRRESLTLSSSTHSVQAFKKGGNDNAFCISVTDEEIAAKLNYNRQESDKERNLNENCYEFWRDHHKKILVGVAFAVFCILILAVALPLAIKLNQKDCEASKIRSENHVENVLDNSTESADFSLPNKADQYSNNSSILLGSSNGSLNSTTIPSRSPSDWSFVRPPLIGQPSPHPTAKKVHSSDESIFTNSEISSADEEAQNVNQLNGVDSAFSEPSALPSSVPTNNNDSLIRYPTAYPSIEQSSLLQIQSPTHPQIPHLGSCPETYSKIGYYNVGTRVELLGIVYECINYSCSSAAYEPGSATSTLWKEAWKVVGMCDYLPCVCRRGFHQCQFC